MEGEGGSVGAREPRIKDEYWVFLARWLLAETLHVTHLLPQAHGAQKPKPVQEHHRHPRRSGFALPEANALPGALRTRVVWVVRVRARSRGGEKHKLETICRPACSGAALRHRKRER